VPTKLSTSTWYRAEVPAQPFHHGNLRTVLLDAAERTLRSEGLDAVSLRELARQAGVSHGAPRRHFPDRQSLLDALAENGFRRLTDTVKGVAVADGADYSVRFQALARGYVDFAVGDTALMELMFTMKATPAPGVRDAAGAFFGFVEEVLGEGQRLGQLALADTYRLQMLLVATLQGIVTLVASGRLPAEQVDDLITDATTLFTRSAA
jgi:AcrR family transcriptional regulator